MKSYIFMDDKENNFTSVTKYQFSLLYMLHFVFQKEFQGYWCQHFICNSVCWKCLSNMHDILINLLHLKRHIIPFVLQLLSCMPQVPDFSAKWRYIRNCVCYNLCSNVNTAYLLSLISGTPRSTTDCIQIRSSCKLQPGERVCQRGPSHFSSVSRRYALYPMAKGNPRLATATLRPSMLKPLVISDRQVYVPVLIR